MTKEAAVATKIGLLAVRRSILIDAPPERVWQEFEDPERFRLWFGTGHTLLRYEPRVGADVELSIEHEGRTLYYGGQITTFEPPNELTFESMFRPNEDGWDAPTLITIRVTAALGGSIVELFHHRIERVGAGAAENHRGFESGWTMRQLEALREIVEA